MHAPFNLLLYNFWFYEAILIPIWIALSLRPAMLVRFFGVSGERGLYFIVTIIAFLAIRLQAFAIDGPLNPDEAQMAAQAIKATVDLWPWHGFDGATGGPLDSDFLALPALLGLPISFVSTRILAAVLELLTSLALFVAFRNVYGEVVARLALIAPLTFFIFTTEPNFVHYSSEHLPVFLIAVAIAGLTVCFTRERHTTIGAAVAGICLVLALFAKLQAAPEAAYVFAIACLLFVRERGRRTLRARAAFPFAIGAIATAVMFVAATAVTGSLRDAAVSYLFNNVKYMQSGWSFSAASYFSLASPTQSIFSGVVPLLLVMTVIVAALAPKRNDWLAIGATFGMIAAAIFAINAAGHNFQHYLFLAILPIAVAIAVLLGTLVNRRGLNFAMAAFLPAVVAIVVLPSFWSRSIRGDVFAYTPSHGPVAAALSQMVAPRSRISVWGWMPEYYVYTQTVMATRDATTTNLIVEGPNQAFYRARYMREFEAAPPEIFVEAVGPGSFAFHSRKTEGFETFPLLRWYIGTHYRFAGEVAGVRLYRHLSRPL